MNNTHLTILVVVFSLVLVTTIDARGIPDAKSRVERSSSDQRIAELQALMALVKSGDLVAHGQYDPFRIGKRKRSGFQPKIETSEDARRWELVKAIVSKEAEELSNGEQ